MYVSRVSVTALVNSIALSKSGVMMSNQKKQTARLLLPVLQTLQRATCELGVAHPVHMRISLSIPVKITRKLCSIGRR